VKVILATVLSFTTAQIVKAVIRRDLKAVKDYGGMPSGHTALLLGALTSLGLEIGFSSPCFGFALAVTLLLLSDILRLRPKVSPEFTHTPLQMIVGGLIGIGMAFIVSALPLS